MMTERLPSRQLPLDLAYRPGLTRDDLVVAPANSRAVALIDRWPDWPSPAVVLAGPAGAGKSHLAAVWRDLADACELRPDAVGPQADLAAAHGRVLVEDADTPDLDEQGLFHLINAMRAGGGHLLLTARRFPLAWGVSLPDLLSRLKAASLVEIEEPDDVLLAGVITKLFADRQVEVEPHVVQFLVRRIERSLSTAIEVVDRLDRAALERKTRITRALAAEMVSLLDAGQGELGL
jgi:chromosomal replication initiation ATPase DnaA